MRYNLIKNIGFFAGTVAVNAALISEAIKANERYNRYLSTLSPDEIEKLKARDSYLEKNGRFFGSGVVLGERADVDAYNALSADEKERILIQYRWDMVRHESSLKK